MISGIIVIFLEALYVDLDILFEERFKENEW